MTESPAHTSPTQLITAWTVLDVQSSESHERIDSGFSTGFLPGRNFTHYKRL
jgi:hypothetical protein